MKILILNGPNLNLLGKRNKDIYGQESFESFLLKLKADFPTIDIDYNQSNVEGELINILHRADSVYDAVVLNAGGYTHTSVSLTDAVESISIPVVEVHISQVLCREDFRQISYLAKNVIGTISGFGLKSYSLAIHAIIVHKKID